MRALYEYFVSGGPLMWPILVCSVLSWAIIIERAARLRRQRFVDDAGHAEIVALLERGEVRAAEQRASGDPRATNRIVAKAIHAYRHSAPDINVALEETAARELNSMSDHLITLNTAGRVAILIGLLGTVVGMVNGFKNLTGEGVDKAAVAEAISVALITTVGGLAVAIPAIIGESAIRGKIRRLTAEIEDRLTQVADAVIAGGATKELVHIRRQHADEIEKQTA